jgi:hypothetical protein
MPFDDAAPAPGNDAPGHDGEAPGQSSDETLIGEIRAAADAAVSQVRKVAATASSEARISVASVIWMASAMMLAVALLIVAWSCVVGLGVWLAIDAGWPVSGAILGAALANVAAAGLCRIWYVRLSHNIGFPRTLNLLFGAVEWRDEHSR